MIGHLSLQQSGDADLFYAQIQLRLPWGGDAMLRDSDALTCRAKTTLTLP
jgi:hypothetical protein